MSSDCLPVSIGTHPAQTVFTCSICFQSQFMQKRSFSRSALGAIFLAVAVGGVTAQASPAIEPFAVGANIPYASGSEAMQQVVNAQCHWTASAIVIFRERRTQGLRMSRAASHPPPLGRRSLLEPITLYYGGFS